MRATILLVFLLSFLGLAQAQADLAPAGPVERNQIVAKVNKAIITQHDVDRELADFWRVLQADQVRDPREKAAEYAYAFQSKLVEMISRELTVQLGREAGIGVSEEYVERAIRAQADELEGGLTRFVEILSEQGLTLDQARQAIEEDRLVQEVVFGATGLKQAEGLSLPPLDSYISPQEVWAYYQDNLDSFSSDEAIKLSAVVISKRRHRKKAEGIAQEARRRALSGENFAAVARAMSDIGKDNGGQIKDGEWIKPGQDLRPKWEAVVWGLPRGATSDVIDDDNAYVILHIDDKQVSTTATFEEVQDRIKDSLQRKRVNENFIRIQRRLQQEAYIWPDQLAAGRR